MQWTLLKVNCILATEISCCGFVVSNAESIDDSSSRTPVSLKLMRIECDRFQAATTLNVVILIIVAVSTHTVTVQAIQ